MTPEQLDALPAGSVVEQTNGALGMRWMRLDAGMWFSAHGVRAGAAFLADLGPVLVCRPLSEDDSTERRELAETLRDLANGLYVGDTEGKAVARRAADLLAGDQ